MDRKALHRIIDANINRLKEALRVIEEVARLGKNHSSLSRSLKSIRHDVQKSLIQSPLSYNTLLKSRNAHQDVGRKLTLKDRKRVTARDLQIANFKRAEESARVLEELFKLVSDKTAARFQAIRFRIYQVEKKLLP